MFLGPLQDEAFHFETESIKSNIVATKENRKQENLVSLNRGLSYSNAKVHLCRSMWFLDLIDSYWPFVNIKKLT